MRLATFFKPREDVQYVGMLTPDRSAVITLDVPEGLNRQGVASVIQYQSDGGSIDAILGQKLNIRDVRLAAPIPRPARNIFCVGRNYHDHAKELADSVFSASSSVQWPIVFTKFPETVIATGENVVLPVEISEQIDYEAELAVIIGKRGKNIRRADAAAYVYGYTILNDVTARDVQMRHQQWVLGKSFDTFCPMGPWVVTADELDGGNTRIRCWVNSELRQDAHTRDLIFDIPAIIEACSRGITLLPGDIIATGTAAGVGMGRNPPSFLNSGDVVRIEVDGIGVLENKFIA